MDESGPTAGPGPAARPGPAPRPRPAQPQPGPAPARAGQADPGPRPAPAPRSAGRDPRAAETRAALIDGAITALREVGFAGASSRQIAYRAGCNQALIFYHFGSVSDLLVAALEDISARRMTAYSALLGHTGTLAGLIDAARTVFVEDLDAGHVTVLAEMISGAQSMPGLGEQVAACLSPWRAFAEQAVQGVLASSPAASLVPARDVAHGVVAGILGLEMLASLDGDRASALALFDHARAVAGLLDLAGGLITPGGGSLCPMELRPTR